MKLSAEPFWEKLYRSSKQGVFGTESEEIRELANKLKTDTKVLDLGCGDGRNAIFLAAKGFDITAVDISKAGLKRLESNAVTARLKIETIQADMRTFEFPTNYDLIISHGCLHLISRDEWLDLISRIKSKTSVDGYNVVVVFTNQIEPPDDLKEFCLGLFNEGELFELYSDWRIIQQEAYILEDEHEGGIRHRHPINKLVARKQI